MHYFDVKIYLAVAHTGLKVRNLTKSQQAMGHAMLYPEPETRTERAKKGGKKGGRGRAEIASSQSEEAIKKPFSDALLSEAREVAARFELLIRINKLSFEHHRLVAALDLRASLGSVKKLTQPIPPLVVTSDSGLARGTHPAPSTGPHQIHSFVERRTDHDSTKGEAFGSNYSHVNSFPALQIPMRALLVLSKPSVPQEVRDEASFAP